MSNYVVKKKTSKKMTIHYQESEGYSFHPKGANYETIAKVTIVDNDLKKNVIEAKISRDYQKIVKQIYDMLNESSDDSSNVLTAYTELDRLRKIFLTKYAKLVKKEMLVKYLKKLQILELEIKKLMLSVYRSYEMKVDFEREGKSR